MDPKILRILWEKCVIGLAEVDLTGKFTKANPAFCAILGYSEAELQKKTWVDITHPEDAQAGSEMLVRLASGEIEEYTVQKRYITKKGHILWVDLLIMPLKGEDQKVAYFLKQVQTSPILLPSEPIKTQSVIKENWKAVIAGVVGAIMAVVGVLAGHSELQTFGFALTVGVFGNLMGKQK